MNQILKTTCACALLMGLFLFQSCKGSGLSKDDSLKYISTDATQISSFNIENLMDEMDFESVQEFPFYKEAIREAGTEDVVFAEILKDPKSSGVDITKNVYQFTEVNATTLEPDFTGVSFNIKDEAAFEKLVKASMGPKAKQETIADYEVVSSREVVVAWNGEVGVSGTGRRRKFDNVIEKFFNQEKENSIANQAELKTALSAKSDIAFWANSNIVAKNPGAQMLGFVGINPKGLEENYVTGRANFETGKAIFDLDYKINPELSKDLNLFFKDELKADFSDFIPEANRASLMTVAIDFKGIYQVLQEKNFLSYAAKAMGPLREFGLDIKDITDAFGGDIALATYKNGDKMDGIFATDVNETKVLELLAIGLKSGSLTDEGNGLYKINDESIAKNIEKRFNNDSSINFNTEAKILVKDGKLFISGNAEYLAQIAKGGFGRSARVDSAVYKKLSNNIFGWDSTKEMNFKGKDGQEIKIDGLQIISDRTNSHSELKLDDKSKNALKQIMDQVNEAFQKKHREEERKSL